MDLPTYDILVVGAGAAGGAAALAAVREGARVLMVERRAEIGKPVRCAEYIPAMLVGQLNLGKSFVVQATHSMKTYISGHPVSEMNTPGYTIDRGRFDQTIVDAAVDAGAELMCATRAVGRIADDRVQLRQKGGHTLKVKAAVIIGADGPHTTVGSWVGIANTRLLPGVQMTLPLTSAMVHTEIYFEPEFFAGYGWLFPKKEFANVGLDLQKGPQNPERLRKLLNKFVDKLRTAGKIAGDPVSFTAGWIPAQPVRAAVNGNILLAGDAAGQTHAITGA